MDQDFEALVDILSAPPQHREFHIGATDGSRWESKCFNEVLPAILRHLRDSSDPAEDGIRAVRALQKAHEHPEVGRHSDFYDHTWAIIEACIEYSGTPVLDILCDMVGESTNPCFAWDRAVRTLIEHNHKAVAEKAVPGVIQRYSTRQFVKMINKKEFDAAFKAIYVFDWDRKEEATKALLESDDEQLKSTVIESLSSHGDSDALPLLKKRLGGLFKKPESDDFLRSRIQKAIEKIKERRK